MATIVSHTNKFVFIHIPKNAGSSVSSVFEPYASRHSIDCKLTRSSVDIISQNTGVNLYRMLNGRIIAEHASLNEVTNYFPEIKSDNYYKFAIVRNPWDMVVSSYHYNRNHSKSRFLRTYYWKIRKLKFREWIDFHQDFLEQGFIKTQSDMCRMNDQGPIDIDTLVRFEDLEKGINRVFDDLGIPAVKVPRRNNSKRTSYRNAFDTESAKVVAKLYEEDLDNFKYTF